MSSYKNLLFFGVSKYKFRKLKIRFNLLHKTQIHHIIPKQFKTHSCLQNLKIDDGCNLMLLPNKKGATSLNTKRPIHEGPHISYNAMIEKKLDEIKYKKTSQNCKEYEIAKLIKELRGKIRQNEIKLK